MRIRVLGLLAAILLAICSTGGPQAADETLIEAFPLNSANEIGALKDVTFDGEVSSDGKGSWKIVTSEPTTAPIAVVNDLDVENARLIYRAQVRTDNFKGGVFIEMWCRFPGKGEYFSKGLQSVVSGTTDWTTVETPFFLQKGQNPDRVRLNLVLNGSGTAWIDDVKLLKAPLQ
jgi:hypothetical protein